MSDLLHPVCYICQSVDVGIEHLNLSGQVLPWCWSCKTEFMEMAGSYKIVIPEPSPALRQWEREVLGL